MSADGAVRRIEEQVERIAESAGFQKQVGDAGASSGDLMVINNSFLYRDAVKTTKSRSYLAVPVNGDGSVGEPGVVEFSKMDATFKHVAQRSQNLPIMAGLDEAVEEQLAQLGRWSSR